VATDHDQVEVVLLGPGDNQVVGPAAAAFGLYVDTVLSAAFARRLEDRVRALGLGGVVGKVAGHPRKRSEVAAADLDGVKRRDVRVGKRFERVLERLFGSFRAVDGYQDSVRHTHTYGEKHDSVFRYSHRPRTESATNPATGCNTIIAEREGTSMKACVLEEWGGSLTVETVPDPEPGPTDVRVDVRACGVTRTIENAIQGGLADEPALTPRIPGHEFAGVVDAVGDAVAGIEPGDRVVAYFYLTCGACDACRRGETNRCLEFDGWYGVDCDGAYAEKALVPAANALPLPDEATFAMGAIAADGLATPLHVCRRASVDDTDTVLVVGAAGRVGVHLCQLAALRGARVLAADVDEARLEHVDSMTDDAVRPIGAREDRFADRLREATPDGDGPTVVVDTVGDLETLRAAWDAMAMGGRLVSLTTHHERAFDPLLKEFVVKEGALLGSRYATKDEVVRAARLLADGRIEPVVTERVGLEDVPAVHERIRSDESHGMVVLEP
jgi:D-arabinose 1-dehydrogenase-like Zn-dependent alcohol dehydrogenase